jgi:hypothetical protein
MNDYECIYIYDIIIMIYELMIKQSFVDSINLEKIRIQKHPEKSRSQASRIKRDENSFLEHRSIPLSMVHKWYDISTDFYISGVDWLNHWLFQVNGRYCTFHFLKYVRAKGENSPKLLLYFSTSLGTWNGHWLEDVPWYGRNLMP